MVIHDKGYFFVEKAFTCSILKQRKCKPISITILSKFSLVQIIQDLDTTMPINKIIHSNLFGN